MLGFNGGLIGVQRDSSRVAASGLWLPNEQVVAQRMDRWPSLRDPLFDQVALLLPMNGTNNSIVFPDASLNGFTVTANGDARISTAQGRWGGSSGVFDSAGDFLSLASHLAFNFGTGDFTIEAWVRFVVAGTPIAHGMISGVGTGGMFLTFFNGSPFGWSIGRQNVAFDHVFGGSLSSSVNVWRHVAATRLGTAIRFFIDGVQLGPTLVGGQSYDLGLSGLRIAEGFNGFMNDLRVTRAARYVGDFPVPAGPFPVS